MSRFVRAPGASSMLRNRDAAAMVFGNRFQRQKVLDKVSEMDQLERETRRAQKSVNSSEVTVDEILMTKSSDYAAQKVNEARRKERCESKGEFGEYTSENNRRPQAAFDNIAVKAILEYCNPNFDMVKTHELWSMLRKVDPSFHPTQYGTPQFGILIAGCRYFFIEHGYIKFMRRYATTDRERRGKPIGLALQYFKPIGQDCDTVHADGRNSWQTRPDISPEAMRRIRWT